MKNVADYAADFARRAKSGGKPVVRVAKQYAEAFLGELCREGVNFARACIDEIHDPELRRVIEALFFSTTAGAVAGAAIGFSVGGPGGARTGAAVGAGAGLLIGCIAVIVTVREEHGPHGPEFVVGVA